MAVSDYGNDENDDDDGDADGVNDYDEVVGHRFDPELDRIDEAFPHNVLAETMVYRPQQQGSKEM